MGVRTVVRSASCMSLALLLLTERTGQADTLSRGSVSLETRMFEPDDVGNTEDYGLALTTRLEVKYRSSPWRVVLNGFARLDALDETRNIFALEEATIGYSLGPLSLTIGSQTLNWSTTEAFHPSDIVNSRNFDSDLANPEKLGEPMVELQLRFLQGSLSAYVMPVRIAPNLVPATSRQSFLPADAQLAEEKWVDRNGEVSDELFAPQGAVRLSQTIGPADITLHVADHSDRGQPTYTLMPSVDNPEVLVATPHYHSVTQVGVSYVQVFGSILFKLEGAMRSFRAPEAGAGVPAQRSHEIAAAGLEYTWTTRAGHQATVIAEGQAVNQDRDIRSQLDPFQRDVLVGYRHFFNDVKGRDLLVLFIADAERPNEYLASLQYGQRLTDQWSIAGFVRSLRIFAKDINQAQLTLTRNF
jgi:hypothetical protein